MIGAVEPTMKMQFVEEAHHIGPSTFLDICFLNEQRSMCVMFLGYMDKRAYYLFLHTELYHCSVCGEFWTK
jgi:hypothetical protein